MTKQPIFIGCKWQALENVALNEGKSLGDIRDKTLEQCKALCEQTQMCASFAYSSFGYYKGSCSLKDKHVEPNEAQKVATGYQTYYKACYGNIDMMISIATLKVENIP